MPRMKCSAVRTGRRSLCQKFREICCSLTQRHIGRSDTVCLSAFPVPLREIPNSNSMLIIADMIRLHVLGLLAYVLIGKAAFAEVTVEPSDRGQIVKIDGKIFTEYLTKAGH